MISIFALIAVSLFYCVDVYHWLIQNVCFPFSMRFWPYYKPQKLIKPMKMYKYEKGYEVID